ncbi:polyketide synthase [Thermothelomyces thermophilus ATCC 42464]|uniref:Polyketide synthase n=1 Tax=Thermothelomyces thermophilus (strain ATCC 42464 / BCRC 31852 / DSM 1799) TaxID=573729 RepID=G2QJ58_THET4|nr:polyketide synthase [Thermothelomyces thermophilus ATCC 42464]AEO59633.1 polyketide synthase [Thermothelomyces thermophilus ATCC 42464]
MSASYTRDILVFSGQGSKQHLVDSGAPDSLIALLGEKQKVAYSTFLRRAQDALLREYSSIKADSGSLGHGNQVEEEVFEKSEHLLVPPSMLQSHPVFETISLYTRHILELMLYQSQQQQQRGTHVVRETTGICTGALAAILAAAFSSYDSDDFVRAAVEGVRLAFWIGVRAASLSVERERLEESSGSSSCVLGVFGVTEKRMGELLKGYYAEESEDRHGNVRISAVFSDVALSLSGDAADLQRVKTYLEGRSIECRWAHIHALYHGGSKSKRAVDATLSDAARRNIAFPGRKSLHASVISAADGAHMGSGSDSAAADPGGPEETKTNILLERALRNIFIDTVDWKGTSAGLRASILDRLEGDSSAAYRIIGVGPGSRSLLDPFRGDSAHPGLGVIDNLAESLAQPAQDDIAIVGLSVNFPGAKGQEQFWQLLASGLSTVAEIPPSRFGVHVQDSDEAHGRSRGNGHANCLDNSFDFDPAYFNVSPREAKSMDPQQRLVLMAALEALEDAGYAPDSTPTFQRERIGVYMGVATGDYVDNLRDDMDVYYSPGTLRAFIAGRVSYAFKFGGPSMVTDTACSSSLVSIYHACRALRAGECGTALAGGVNTMSSPDMYNGLARAHFLSPTGQCKPFDAAADGYCRAEGCGLVVLKRLADAVAEGDHIYAVIRAIGVNQCGKARSITHPHANTQASLMRTVLASARASPRSIGVVEAHGTGTQAGDAAEMASIRSVFCPRPPDQPLYVSSVKGNFGHSEAASGVAGLAKLLLMMDRRQIPPQTSFVNLNPKLPANRPGEVTIPTRMTEWKEPPGQPTTPRRALVNNFGASGSNAALVLEEYVVPPPRGRPHSTNNNNNNNNKRSHHLLNISAKTAKALEAARRDLLAFLSQNPDVGLQDLCYTANARRQEYPTHRWSAVVSDRGDLAEQLGGGHHHPAKGATTTTATATAGGGLGLGLPAKTVFVFSGQGGVYAGMGAALLATVPLFRSIADRCDETLVARGFPPVSPFLAGSAEASSSSSSSSSSWSAEDQIIISQCACFVLEYALAETWRHWGVTPDLVIGHSIGEYAAFAFAGMIGWEDALLLLAGRARLLATRCPPQVTGMVACRLSRAAVEQLLADKADELAGITVSCFNSPSDSVLAGPVDSLARLARHCKDNGIRHKRLDVPYGFHSPALEPILSDHGRAARAVPFRPPSLRAGSSLRGRLFGQSETVDGDYFVQHAREPVNFSGVVEDALPELAGSHPTFIEIGPSPSTESMLKQIINTSLSYTFLGSLTPTRAAWDSLSSALRELYLRRYDIKWRRVYDGSQAKFVRGFPGHPLNLATYYVPYKPPSRQDKLLPGFFSGPQQPPPRPKYAFLTDVSPAVEDGSATRYASTAMEPIKKFVDAHQVGDVPLFPASVYVEVVAQALAYHASLDIASNVFMFENVKFEHPLVCGDDAAGGSSRQVIKTALNMQPVEGQSYVCSSGSGDTLCAGGVRSLEVGSQAVVDILARRRGRVDRLRRSVDGAPRSLAESFSDRTIYHVIFPRVVRYDKPLMTLRQLTTVAAGSEGHGYFTLPLPPNPGRYVSSPALVDTLLHAPGFMANTLVDADSACICVALEQALVPSDSPSLHRQELQVYCSLVDIEHSLIADAYVLDAEGSIVGYVEGMCFKKLKLKPFKAHLSRQLARRRPAAAAPAPAPAPVPAGPSSGSVGGGGRGRPVAGDYTTATTKTTATATEISSTVCSIVRGLCGVDYEPTEATTLAELGLDSLLSVELSHTLAKTLRCTVSPDQLQECSDLAQVVQLVAKNSPLQHQLQLQQHEQQQQQQPTAPPTTAAPSVLQFTPATSSLDSSASSSFQPDQPATPNTEYNNIATSSTTISTTTTNSNNINSNNNKPTTGNAGSAAAATSLPEFQSLFLAVCGVLPEDEDDERSVPLSALGVDSLLSIELCQALRDKLGVTVEDHDAVGDLTYRQLHDMCACAAATKLSPGPASPSPEAAAPSPPPTPQTAPGIRQLQKRGDGSGRSGSGSGSGGPLYLFHDGSGTCGMYARVGPLGRDVYGVPSLRSDAQTLEALAADYIRQANLGAPQGGPLILAGWSFGGVLAFEIARQLGGAVVKGVVLIDSPAPVDHQPLPAEVIHQVVSGRRSASASALASASAREMQEAVEANFKRFAAMLGDYSRRHHHHHHHRQSPSAGRSSSSSSSSSPPPCVMVRCVKTMDRSALGGAHYPWLGDPAEADRSIRTWERLLGRQLPVLELHCDHFSPFEPENVGELTQHLRTACEMLEDY